MTPNAILRAMLIDMDEWVSKGTEPPASLVPSVAKGTLVPPLPQEKQGFPKLQGVTYNGRMHTGDLFDYGPEFDKGIMTVLPPKLVGTPYPAPGGDERREVTAQIFLTGHRTKPKMS